MDQELVHRELYRKSQDDCMVYNPTDEDFTIEWEPGLRFLVPNRNKDIGWGNGRREVKRYLAEWYCRHMKDHMINKIGKERTEELLAQRPKGEAFVTKWHENTWLGPQIPRTDDPELTKEIYQTLFLGVTHEFGLDTTKTVADGTEYKSAEEKIMETIANKRYEAAEALPETPSNNQNSVTSEASVEELFPEIKEVVVTPPMTEEAPLYVSKKDREKQNAGESI